MVNKSNNLFSLIPVDLTHEQENNILKENLYLKITFVISNGPEKCGACSFNQAEFCP